MATKLAEDEEPPVPNWLLKLEEQREKRLKVKLGHEAGAGALCQVCGDKCPGLDLHFWRKICKICKCGKEDHDISDEDIYGFVQFTLLGSKPVKSKGIFLKGRKDEVILEFTPKGSSNDVKKYLDELPADMLPVKGTEAAKLRKQRLQKQMPAHDVDPTLCHALTDQEIKELEEYVAHIRKHSVGQGKIIRLPLFKGSLHSLSAANSQFLSQNHGNQIASSQQVYLQASDLSNNLQNLTLRDKNIPHLSGQLKGQTAEKLTKIVEDQQNPTNQKTKDIVYNPSTSTSNKKLEFIDNLRNDCGLNNETVSSNMRNNANLPSYASKSMHQIVDNQTPVLNSKMTDLKYPINELNSSSGIVHPLTTSNVERHQEQFENPNFELNNANLERVFNPNLNYAPNFINPIEQHQIPVNISQIKDLKYPQTTFPVNNANIDPIYNPLQQFNPNYNNPVEQFQIIPSQPIEDLKYHHLNYPVYDENGAEIPPPINETTHPNFKANNDIFNSNMAALEQIKPKDLTHRAQIPVLQAQNLINPLENHQNLTSVGFIQDINYPTSELSEIPAGLPPPFCHECKDPFIDGSVAVTAERTTNLWHSKCFNCHSCKQPLADLLYLYHKESDNIYCGRDYAILKGIPRCAACDELIFVPEYCLAENSTFHVKHFCCFECDQPLAGKSYLMENNQPVCVECYENLKAENCQDCKKIISPDQQGVSLQDLHWHATDDCFACKKCRKPLLNGKMLLRNENLFCSDICYKSY